MQHPGAHSANATPGVGAPSPQFRWPITGEQHVKDDDGSVIQVTAGEAKMLLHVGAIARTEVPGIWAITIDWDYDSVQDYLYDAAQDLAQDRELHGWPEDTPSIANCDDAGTGEGRWHGRL